MKERQTIPADALPKKSWKDGTFYSVLVQFSRKKTAIIGLCILLAMILISVFAGVLSPYDYTKIDPIHANQTPSAEHLLRHRYLRARHSLPHPLRRAATRCCWLSRRSSPVCSSASSSAPSRLLRRRGGHAHPPLCGYPAIHSEHAARDLHLAGDGRRLRADGGGAVLRRHFLYDPPCFAARC